MTIRFQEGYWWSSLSERMSVVSLRRGKKEISVWLLDPFFIDSILRAEGLIDYEDVPFKWYLRGSCCFLCGKNFSPFFFSPYFFSSSPDRLLLLFLKFSILEVVFRRINFLRSRVPIFQTLFLPLINIGLLDFRLIVHRIFTFSRILIFVRCEQNLIRHYNEKNKGREKYPWNNATKRKEKGTKKARSHRARIIIKTSFEIQRIPARFVRGRWYISVDTKARRDFDVGYALSAISFANYTNKLFTNRAPPSFRFHASLWIIQTSQGPLRPISSRLGRVMGLQLDVCHVPLFPIPEGVSGKAIDRKCANNRSFEKFVVFESREMEI